MTPRRILVVRAGALGDTLMATPVLRALRERHPAAVVGFLASAAAAPVLELNPHLQHVWPIRYRNLPAALSLEKRRLVRSLAAVGYDLAIVLEHADGYYELVRHAGIRDVIGFRQTSFDPGLHSIVNNLRAAGFDDWRDRPLEMDLPVSAEDERKAAALLGDRRAKLAGIHAGYGPSGRKKRQEARLKGWSVENFAELGRRLIDRGFSLVLTGSDEDRRLADRIASRLPAGSCLQLAGLTSLRELAAVISRLALFVSVDSGPAHVAAAVGTPLVVLWGPAILDQTRPVGARGPIAIVRNAVFCAPCYNTPLMKACRQNICMESISPRQAMEAVDTLLETPKPAGVSCPRPSL